MFRAAVMRVSLLSGCRMLEDDLKISSDEEEAEQQVSAYPTDPPRSLIPLRVSSISSSGLSGVQLHYIRFIFIRVTFTDRSSVQEPAQASSVDPCG